MFRFIVVFSDIFNLKCWISTKMLFKMSKTYLWLMNDLSCSSWSCYVLDAHALYALTKFNEFLFLSNPFSSVFAIDDVSPFFSSSFFFVFFYLFFLFFFHIFVVVFLFFLFVFILNVLCVCVVTRTSKLAADTRENFKSTQFDVHANCMQCSYCL